MPRDENSQQHAPHFAGFFTVDDIVCGVGQMTREELIRELVRRLAANHPELGPAAPLADAVLAREAVSATILAPGVALPHARIAGLPRLHVAIATSAAGIPFAADRPPARLVILMLVPLEQPAIYLQALRSLEPVVREEAEERSVSRLASAGEVMRHFAGRRLHLPDFVCAADVMSTDLVTLAENDNLKTAIDLFVDRQMIEIPVVDKEGDLVGVVSAGALLRVCLPEYLLWLEDLSPIRNFEPFAAVLRNETSTWLGEIMSERYAAVQLDAPAIAVAAEFSRLNTTRCYVLEGRRLAGVVTLQRFLAKVFRE